MRQESGFSVMPDLVRVPDDYVPRAAPSLPAPPKEMPLEQRIILELARTMGSSFQMDTLIDQVKKPGDDVRSRMHNHLAEEAAWELVDDGHIIPDGAGAMKVKC